MQVVELVKAARRLRADGKIQESFDLVRDAAGIEPAVIWQHQTLFWDELAAGNCLLTRRNAADAEFIKTLWDNEVFVHRFHRRAARIPRQLTDLERILNSEYVSLVGDLNSIHWLVRDGRRTPWGVLSLVNVSLVHQRAEVLLGLKSGAPFGLAAAAMLLLFRFYFAVLKFQKLCSLTFDDNEHSRRGTLHLGFKVEGRFRRHFYDESTQTFIDVVQAGLLAREAFSWNNERLMQRLNFNQV